MPTVDVIIPAYNAAHFLPSSIESVMAQTFTDWRILLVDDGSRDNIAEVIALYQQRLGDKLKYIRQENAGLPAARNTAIRNSTAEFLALLDADDVWLPRRLELSLARFEGHPEIGLTYGFNARIDPAGRVIDTFARRNPHGEGWVAPYLYTRSLDMNCPTITFRRRCVDEVGLFDETLRATEDRDLWVRIALRYQVGLVPEVIAHYRVSPQAMTTDPERMFTAQVSFIEKNFGSPGLGRLQRRMAYACIYRQRAEALVDRGQTAEAKKAALQTLAFYPLSSANLRTSLSVLFRSLRSREPKVRSLAAKSD